jgi:tRNA threonylcarbamoyladenosine biosynthesis protein TsaE
VRVIESKNAEETQTLARALAADVQAGDWIGLIGDLGAGKTCFAQGLLAGLGVAGPVKSPTFSLVHSYDDGQVPAHHLDLYRLGGPDDLESIGYDDLTDGDAVVIVEWADRLGDWQPDDGLLIRFASGSGTHRVLRLVALGDRGHALAAALVAAEATL